MSQENSTISLKDLSFIDQIKTMAVIGPSEKRNFFFLRSHQQSFKGKLYAVHKKIKSIPGFDDGTQGKIYTSVKEIPEDVDFVFIAVPASKILGVIDDCVEKGVKLASIFTAEFSDSGTREGIELERELVRRAKNKLRILGPNGLGLFYPKLGIAWRNFFPKQAGNVGFVAQSGGICNIVIYTGMEIGINFSKVFSMGNGADLDAVDLINFLNNDSDTEIILCYIEGIKKERGKAFKQLLNTIKKPLVILKGGQTNTGSKAVKSHTASLSGNQIIWKSIFKQYNLIEVDSLEELINAALLIDFYGIRSYENVAVLSISGGYGVIMVDLIEKYGLKIKPFKEEIEEKIKKKLFMRGTSPKNPIDISAQLFQSESVKEIVDIALSDENIDCLVMDLPSYYFDQKYSFRKDPDFEKNLIDTMCLGHAHGKSLIPIIQETHCPEMVIRIRHVLREKKVPVFKQPLEVIPILAKITNYYKKLKEK
ncbi:MAG: CoA-binding protein [Promethearchaeota archaeon]